MREHTSLWSPPRGPLTRRAKGGAEGDQSHTHVCSGQATSHKPRANRRRTILDPHRTALPWGPPPRCGGRPMMPLPANPFPRAKVGASHSPAASYGNALRSRFAIRPLLNPGRAAALGGQLRAAWQPGRCAAGCPDSPKAGCPGISAAAAGKWLPPLSGRSGRPLRRMAAQNRTYKHR